LQKHLISQKNRLKTELNDTYPQHVIEYHWDNSWNFWQTVDLKYNPWGFPTEIIYTIGEGEEASKTRKLYSYNTYMEETEVLEQYFDPENGGWINLSRKRSQFEGKYQTEFMYEIWADDHWEVNNGLQWVYSFDDHTRVSDIVTKEYVPELGTFENRTKQGYSYPNTTTSFYNEVYIDRWTGTDWLTFERWDYTWTSDMYWELLVYRYTHDNGVTVTLTSKVINDFRDYNIIFTTYNAVGQDFYTETRITVLVDDHANFILNKFEMGDGTKEGWNLFSALEYDLTYSGNNVIQRITKEYFEGAGWVNSIKEDFSDFISLSSKVPQKQEFNLTLFPNPASAQTVVNLSNLETDVVTVGVVAMNGQLISEETIEVSGNTANFTLNLVGFDPGIYMVLVFDRTGKKIGAARVIKN
jgi:hypothetical protein